MKLKTYGKFNAYGETDRSYSHEELQRNLHLVTSDTECPWCGKLQPALATVYLGGPCCRCGKLTSGAETPPPDTRQEGEL